MRLLVIAFVAIFTLPTISFAQHNQEFGEDCTVILNDIARSNVDLNQNHLAKLADASCRQMPNSAAVRKAIQAAKNSSASTQYELMKSLAVRTLAFVGIERHGNSFKNMNPQSASLITTNTISTGEIAFQKAASANGSPIVSFLEFEQTLLQKDGQSAVRNAPYTEQQSYLTLARLMFETNF